MSLTIENEIRIGNLNNPTYRWDNRKIVLGSTKGVFSVDILGNELSIDTASATVRTNIDAPLAYNPNGSPDVYKTRNGGIYLLRKPRGYGQNFLTDIAPSTPVYWLVAGAVFAKGYFAKVERVSRYFYALTLESGIGLLRAKTHVGGLYSGQTAAALLSSIIGSAFPFTVSEDVGAVMVYGHLPYDNARDNLHRLLFAIGAALTKDTDGNYVVAFLSTTMSNIPKNRIALGGKTQYVTPADSVEVTEHSFFALNSDETVSLFDNSNGAAVSNQLVIFDDPMHDLATSGNLTISESSVNHAVINGVGVLTGKRYTHNAMIIKLGSTSNNVKRVTDNELISFANSYFVAKRVFSYFSSTRTVNAKILLEDEKPGQLLALTDSFGDATNAFLSQMNVSVTSRKVATCKLISGFQPGANGNNYNNRVVITSDRTWTVPSGVTRIRIVLIGGAQGGQGGYDGADGLDQSTTPMLDTYSHWDRVEHHGSQYYYYDGYITGAYRDNNQPPAAGGAAGAAGEKASFLIMDVTVAANDVITFSVGVGGAGGARNGGAGDAGTPTTAQCARFGTLSSADGLVTYEGYNDPVSGLSFATDGKNGVAGGNGGQSTPYGNQSGEAISGGDVSTFAGGAGGNGASVTTDYDEDGFPTLTYDAAPGGGGGAALGANGSAGTDGTVAEEQWEDAEGYPILLWTMRGGNGGNGANAATPEQPSVYGQGGTGGNGGGGGGNAGGWKITRWGLYSGYDKEFKGTRGSGGQGSAGGQGGNGVGFIYY